MSEKKEIIYGACRFCGQTQSCNKNELLDAVRNGIDEDDAPDYVATHNCTCKEAKALATHEMKLEAAGEWVQNVFEKDPEQVQAVLCAVKAVSEHHFTKATFKTGKYLYTLDVDTLGDIRIKTKFTDTQEETF